jgi:hypothetical protein
MARRFLAALLLGAFALGAGSLAAQEPNDALQSKLDFANGLFVRGFFSEATEEYEAYLAALAGQTAPLSPPLSNCRPSPEIRPSKIAPA